MAGILDLLLGGANAAGGRYLDNRRLGDFRQDINGMMDIGTAGVTNDHRSGARDLITGIYDGSISGDEIFNRVPGLRALSDRGADNIMRKMSARGQGQPMDENSGAMREWLEFDKELSSKAWNSEMDRASRIGGFDFNPGTVAGSGLRALGEFYGQQQTADNGLSSNIGRLLGGKGEGSLMDLISKGGKGVLGLINSLFGGSEGDWSDIDWDNWDDSGGNLWDDIDWDQWDDSGGDLWSDIDWDAWDLS